MVTFAFCQYPKFKIDISYKFRTKVCFFCLLFHFCDPGVLLLIGYFSLIIDEYF